MARVRFRKRNDYGGAAGSFQFEKGRRKDRYVDVAGFDYHHQGFKKQLQPFPDDRHRAKQDSRAGFNCAGFDCTDAEFVYQQGRRKVSRLKDAGFDHRVLQNHPQLYQEGKFRVNNKTGVLEHPNVLENGRKKPRKTKASGIDYHHGLKPHHHPYPDQWVGNRGVSRPPWGHGPREPSSSRYGSPLGSSITLFIDGLSDSVTCKELRNLFEKEGLVDDVFISQKARKKQKTEIWIC